MNKKFIHEATTDYGSVLHPDKVAVIAEDDGYEFLIPDGEIEISENAQALVAAAMKIQDDEDFKKEMVGIFK